MGFRFIEGIPASLGVFGVVSSLCMSHAHAIEAVQTSATITPTSPAACIGLESNSDRLACYDALFKVADTAKTTPVIEQKAALNPSPSVEQSELNTQSIKEKIGNLFAIEGPRIDPNTSLLDRRWELSEKSKLGTWNIRGYKPVYLLPIFWTSKKNEFPSSPNPENTVHENQNLTSAESKFQLSLKTKAWENIFGNNGDLWLGYTQSSRWQVYNADESRPFRETNYEPEASLIFRTNYEFLGLNGRLLGVTLNHQSNGRSDPLSRSWNRVIFNVGLERDNFALVLRPWIRIQEEAKNDNNPDIEDYVGRGDLTAFYRWKDNDFSLMLRHSLKDGDKSHGAVQFDWAFPISGKLRGNFQLFNGYGESLIDYNHRATYVGLGVSLMNWY